MAIEQLGESLLSQKRKRDEDQARKLRRREERNALLGLAGTVGIGLYRQNLKNKQQDFFNSEAIRSEKALIAAGERNYAQATAIRDQQEAFAGSTDEFLLQNYAIPKAQAEVYGAIDETTRSKDSLQAEIRKLALPMLEDREVDGKTVLGLRNLYSNLTSSLDRIGEGSSKAYEEHLHTLLPQSAAEGLFQKFTSSTPLETRDEIRQRYVDNANAMTAATSAFRMGLSNTDAERLAEQAKKIPERPPVILERGKRGEETIVLRGQSLKLPTETGKRQNADGSITYDTVFTQPIVQVKVPISGYNADKDEFAQGAGTRYVTYVLNEDRKGYSESGADSIQTDGSQDIVIPSQNAPTDAQIKNARATRDSTETSEQKETREFLKKYLGESIIEGGETPISIMDRIDGTNYVRALGALPMLTQAQNQIIGTTITRNNIKSGVTSGFLGDSFDPENSFRKGSDLTDASIPAMNLELVQAIAGSNLQLTGEQQEELYNKLFETVPEAKIDGVTVQDYSRLAIELSQITNQRLRETFLHDPNFREFFQATEKRKRIYREMYLVHRNLGRNEPTIPQPEWSKEIVEETETSDSAYEAKKIELLERLKATDSLTERREIRDQLAPLNEYLNLRRFREGTQGSVIAALEAVEKGDVLGSAPGRFRAEQRTYALRQDLDEMFGFNDRRATPLTRFESEQELSNEPPQVFTPSQTTLSFLNAIKNIRGVTLPLTGEIKERTIENINSSNLSKEEKQYIIDEIT
jgi:hypothetical protein